MELLEKVLNAQNLADATNAVLANKGAGGVDKLSVEQFKEKYERGEINFEEIKELIRIRKYNPQPVRRVYIPKENGDKRGLGIPTVVETAVVVNDALDKVVIYRLTTKDGVNWNDKKAILTSKRSSNDYLSPAIIYDNGIYKFWSIDKDRKVKYMESVDNYNYKEIRTINLKYQLKSLKNWHMDVIKHDNIYEMIVVAYNNWDDRLSMNLYYFKSNDNINYTDAKIILRPSVNSWDNRGIYRSSLINVDGVYYLYYSAMSSSLERGIGLSYGKDINNLKGFNGETIDL